MKEEKVIGFYRERDEYGCFSNFYRSKFTLHGRTYFCSEQFIMVQKAQLFGDSRRIDLMMRANTPAECKALGREVFPFSAEKWEAECDRLVLPGLIAKFMQNEEIRDILLSTGDAILAECAPRDRIWGIGMGVSNPDVQHPERWSGRNRLGNLLMVTRRIIRDDLSVHSHASAAE